MAGALQTGCRHEYAAEHSIRPVHQQETLTAQVQKDTRADTAVMAITAATAIPEVEAWPNAPPSLLFDVPVVCLDVAVDVVNVDVVVALMLNRCNDQTNRGE